MRFSWVFRRLAPLGAVFAAVLGVLALMLRWGFLCTNIHTIQHINKLCVNHMSGDAIGNLCEPLCVEETIQSLSCHPSSHHEGTIFSAIWKGKRILFKTPKKTSLFESELIHWYDSNNIKQYPSEDEFITMIKNLVLSKINVTISDEEAREISKISDETIWKTTLTTQRMTEMDSAWLLLQDNEYLHTVLFEKSDIFPKRVGTCGSLYAIEYADGIKGTSSLFSLEEDDVEWDRRTHISALILDLLEKIDKAQLQICDVQLNQFGSIAGRLHYTSPASIRRRGTLPKNRSCKSDYDCGYLDCRAVCNTNTSRCNSSVEVNNLQLVCEKIYLGWTAAGRVLLPGLLVSSKASSSLATLLRRCAGPLSLSQTATLKQSLYNILIRRN